MYSSFGWFVNQTKQAIIATIHFYETHTQTMQATITWQRCKDLPSKLSEGQTIVLNGKVYYGGGNTDNKADEYVVYCYDPSQDKWTTLPPLPVKYFGLGQVNGNLVAIGGLKKNHSGGPTDEVFMFDARAVITQKWKHTTIPPMPTARSFAGVLSLQSALVVAGGDIGKYTSCHSGAVEIFRPETSRWYKTDPLLRKCRDVAVVAIDGMCYVLGGYDFPRCLNQVLYASVDDLLRNAVPANQTTHSGSSDTQSAWKTLPNTPTYKPAAAVLAGGLYAVSGRDAAEEETSGKTKVHFYSLATKAWIHVCDLPALQLDGAVASLLLSEMLVIGGWGEDKQMVNTVYKGALKCI